MKEAPEAVLRIQHAELEALEAAAPTLAAIAGKEQAATVRAVEAHVRAGTLTGDVAIQLWHQYRAAEWIMGRVTGHMKASRVILTQGEKAVTQE